MFINYVIKYGYQLKRIFMFKAFIENNMTKKMVKKVQEIDMQPIADLVKIVEYYFILENQRSVALE